MQYTQRKENDNFLTDTIRHLQDSVCVLKTIPEGHGLEELLFFFPYDATRKAENRTVNRHTLKSHRQEFPR